MSLFPRRTPAPTVELSMDDLAMWAMAVQCYVKDPSAIEFTQRGVPRPDLARRAYERAVALAELSRTDQRFFIELTR